MSLQKREKADKKKAISLFLFTKYPNNTLTDIGF